MSRRKRVVETVGCCFVGNTNECMLCHEYCTPSPTGIKLHLKMKHGISKGITNHCPSCFACRKDFKNYGELLNHLKNDHY